ncbi:hypothetical protein IGI04_035838 [Brassica rapa subsp. trilocularis]|uniref:Uncharacterized protein n=1 Tax=Brassica rapa subsp. trilocularis TaxID=1813537 RepID=A0ABQ7LCX8_BRACM|nr:hypothetical protein IGI04_035838 [Brassica rapa subsp. trilocularis]
MQISQTSVTPTTPIKRSRKKKELATMRNLLKQQKERNELLKKIQAAFESQKNDDSSFLLPDLNIPLDNNNSS